MCIVYLKIPRMNEKEAEDGPLKKLNTNDGTVRFYKN